MEAKFTKGPWRWVDCKPSGYADSDMGGFVNDNGVVVCEFGNCEQYYPTEGTPPIPANAHLIASAPDGFKAIEETYISLLQFPVIGELGKWRGENQHILIILRDFLAKATNSDLQETQDHYESVAYIKTRKARGEK